MNGLCVDVKRVTKNLRSFLRNIEMGEVNFVPMNVLTNDWKGVHGRVRSRKVVLCVVKVLRSKGTGKTKQVFVPMSVIIRREGQKELMYVPFVAKNTHKVRQNMVGHRQAESIVRGTVGMKVGRGELQRSVKFVVKRLRLNNIVLQKLLVVLKNVPMREKRS